MGRLRWNVMSRLQLLALVSLLGGLAPLAAGQSLIDSGAMLEDARRLSADAMEGRRVGTPGNAAARRLLVDRFRAVGLEPFGGAFEHPFAVAPDLTGVNIAGELPGRQTGLPWLVVSAHYDHLGIRAGRIFNGANDNASGAAALPAMADYFRRHPIRHPLLVVAFDAEERGMLGAYAFVEALRARGEAVAFNVNVDMVARDRSRTLWVAGVSRQPWLRPVVTDVTARAPVRLRMGHDDPARPADDWTQQSDQWAFIEAGIPAVYVGVEDAELHHDPDDDFESLEPGFYVQSVETVIALIEAIDEALATRDR